MLTFCQLRSNRALNRGNRGAVDHDIMEGLPVRQWRKQNVVVNTQPPKDEAPANNDPNNRWRELPMPRGSEHYSPWSQALLRAARRPRIPQHLSNLQDEDKDLAEEEKPAPEPDAGIGITKWSQLSRDQEQPELEFLAKRRKGLPSLTGETNIASQPMRKVKVKKVDAQGNASVFDVLAPEGAVVDGEIVKDAEVPTEAVAPGTVVAGVGVANEEGVVVAALDVVAPTPPRRGPPRQKRKAKGLGRGRKKKQTLRAGLAAGNLAPGGTDGAQDGGVNNGDTLKVPDASGDAASGSDVDLGDAKDGDEGSDDDEDGDDRDDGDASDMDGPTRSVSPMRQPEHLGANNTAPTAQPQANEADASGTTPHVEKAEPDAALTAVHPSIPAALDTQALNPASTTTPDASGPPAASTEPTSATILAEAPVMSETHLGAPIEPMPIAASLEPLPPVDPTVTAPLPSVELVTEPVYPGAESTPETTNANIPAAIITPLEPAVPAEAVSMMQPEDLPTAPIVPPPRHDLGEEPSPSLPSVHTADAPPAEPAVPAIEMLPLPAPTEYSLVDASVSTAEPIDHSAGPALPPAETSALVPPPSEAPPPVPDAPEATE